MELVSREFRTRLVALLRTLPDLDTESRRTVLLTYLPSALKVIIPRDPSPAIDMANIVAACAAWDPSSTADPHPLALLLATARALAPASHQAYWDALIQEVVPTLGLVPVVPRPRLPLAVGRGGLLLGGLGVLAAVLALTFGILQLIRPPPPRPPATELPSAGEDMVSIPAGPYVLGTDDSQADASEKPPTLLDLRAFQIDRHEVTNEEYRRCWDRSQCTPPEMDSTIFKLEQYNRYPVVGVTAVQAAQYCAWRSARLPREEEWERAVRGPGSTLAELRPWPWGATPAKPNPTVANIYPPAAALAPAGSRPVGRSLEGVDDLIGNVWEWTGSYFSDPDGYGSGPDPWDWTGGAMTGESLVQRGGSFESGIPRSTTRRAVHWQHDTAVDVGFRCARLLP